MVPCVALLLIEHDGWSQFAHSHRNCAYSSRNLVALSGLLKWLQDGSNYGYSSKI
jgi:hypothetical protein